MNLVLIPPLLFISLATSFLNRADQQRKTIYLWITSNHWQHHN